MSWKPRCETCAGRPISIRRRRGRASCWATSATRWAASIAPPSATANTSPSTTARRACLYKLGLAQYRAGQPAACVAVADNARSPSRRSSPRRITCSGSACATRRSPREALLALEQRRRAGAGAAAGARRARRPLRTARTGRRSHRPARGAARRSSPGRRARSRSGWRTPRPAHSDRAVQTLGRARRAAIRTTRHTYVALGRVWLDTPQARDDRVALGKALEALHRRRRRRRQAAKRSCCSGRALLQAADTEAAERGARSRPSASCRSIRWRSSTSPNAAERLGHLDRAREALLDYARARSRRPRTRAGSDGSRVRIAELSMRLRDYRRRRGLVPAHCRRRPRGCGRRWRASRRLRRRARR